MNPHDAALLVGVIIKGISIPARSLQNQSGSGWEQVQGELAHRSCATVQPNIEPMSITISIIVVILTLACIVAANALLSLFDVKDATPEQSQAEAEKLLT